MIPVFLVLYMARPLGDVVSLWLALTVFAVASISDAVDGHLARKYGLETNFGKLMDPLADKLLVSAAFVAFVGSGTLPAWAVIIFISREFFVSGVRMLALEQRAVLAASVGGKIKTVFQMILVHFVLVPLPSFLDMLQPARDIMVWILLIISLAASVLSGIDYGYKNWSVFNLQDRGAKSK